MSIHFPSDRLKFEFELDDNDTIDIPKSAAQEDVLAHIGKSTPSCHVAPH
jgi:hypothetical protein